MGLQVSGAKFRQVSCFPQGWEAEAGGTRGGGATRGGERPLYVLVRLTTAAREPGVPAAGSSSGGGGVGRTLRKAEESAAARRRRWLQ